MYIHLLYTLYRQNLYIYIMGLNKQLNITFGYILL